jgi:DNA-binding CsgD family transcriptional regulator
MGWFAFFRRSKRPRATLARDREPARGPALAVYDLRTHVLKLDAQIETIHIALHRHEDTLAECRSLADQQGKALTRLEVLVDSLSPSMPLYEDRPMRRVCTPPGRAVPEPVDPTPARKLDIDQFSEQQKRLLAVFFQNRDREMSYADVAAVLGKSAHTVKNQMNLIRHKADLFDCITGPESRNFFRLKDDLRIETRLKVGRPPGRPGSTPVPDRSSDEHVTAPTERIL